MISIDIRHCYIVPIIVLLFVAEAANTAPLGDYQGWLWETGITNLEQDEEYCFAQEDFDFSASPFWTGGTTDEVCWGRNITASGRALVNGPPHTSVTLLEQGTRALVSAGGNLYEMFGEDVIGGIGQGEERLGTILATPTDDNLLLLGGYEVNAGATREYFAYLDLLVKNTTAVREARVAANLENTGWRIASFGRLLDSVNQEAAEVTIHTLTLNTSGVCTYLLSGILSPDGFTDNADFFGARYSDGGNAFVNRDLAAAVTTANSSACSYVIDANGYLAITNTVNAVAETVRYVVSDNNKFLVYAPNAGALTDNSQDLAIGFQATGSMSVADIDGTYLVYVPQNIYKASGTGHSGGSTGTQERDGFGRANIVFDSTQAGTAPVGEGGTWFGCDMEMQLNEEHRVLSGVASDTTATVTSSNSVDSFRFSTCDYSLGTDGGLRVWLTFVTPTGTSVTDTIARGYVDSTGELIALVDFVTNTAPGGTQDTAQAGFIVGVQYAGDLTADADGDSFSNYKEFKMPLAQSDTDDDMDGNGNSDILWRNSSTGQSWAYLMYGATIHTSARVNTVPTVWDLVGHGDYNGDGMSDILWRNSATGENWMYLMDGAVIVSSERVISEPDLDWLVVGNGDFDGDGNADILWRHSVTGQNFLTPMNGSTILSSEVIIWDNPLPVPTIDPIWDVAGNADYDGNGTADILWRNSSTGVMWIYFMDGSTVTNSVRVNTVPPVWQVVGGGDYNGDGRADILWRNSSTGQNWLYLMNGATIDSSVGINTISDLNWQIVGDGDYDDDGNADILWRNSSTGQNWMYLMNGATIDSSIGVNTVPTGWELVNLD